MSLFDHKTICSRLILTILLSFAFTLLESQCQGNLIVNGSFNSPVGNNIAAPGWTAFPTPDINDVQSGCNAGGYNWTGTPVSSPDGGTWQSMFFTESVSQSVSFDITKTYEICFFYAAQGISNGSSSTFTSPVGVALTIGAQTFSTVVDSTQFTWEKACFTFKINSSPAIVKFEPTTNNYVGIDGVCFIKSVSTELSAFDNSSNFIIYPNPANEFFTFKLPDTDIGHSFDQLAIYNQLGEVVVNEKLKTIVVTENLPEGIYLIQLIGEFGTTGKRLVILR